MVFDFSIDYNEFINTVKKVHTNLTVEKIFILGLKLIYPDSDETELSILNYINNLTASQLEEIKEVTALEGDVNNQSVKDELFLLGAEDFFGSIKNITPVEQNTVNTMYRLKFFHKKDNPSNKDIVSLLMEQLLNVPPLQPGEKEPSFKRKKKKQLKKIIEDDLEDKEISFKRKEFKPSRKITEQHLDIFKKNKTK